MSITSLSITNFRNLVAVNLTLHPDGVHVFYGNNGSGKTSLLEAIYYLGMGRSFRSNIASHVIRHLTDKFSIFARLLDKTKNNVSIGLEKSLNGLLRMRMAEKELANTTELANQLPIRMIHSQSHQLFEGSPLFRRKYLDWGLFYHFTEFFMVWRNYEQALKQRNKALRDKCSKQELETWTNELIKYGLTLDQLRRDYLKLLLPILIPLIRELFILDGLEITYRSGWAESQDYGSILRSSYQEDTHLGYTQFGPHRADLHIAFSNIPAKHFLSRGQQKLTICGMILAQGLLLNQELNKGLIYLIDDLPSELDIENRSKLIHFLLTQRAQTFITTIDRKNIWECIDGAAEITKVFHVEQGYILE
ncbi:MAG: hypothetical protein A3F42_01985 [Gammaproteobacteria bacterium RIFCSPHIGHO2_12_FULL_37_34]|nr:MAG: hypothetical protein A3F42_01985 [Gammaproteobacteria bacterium RIFCSPHIGHO2_12_FULL_37_34]